MIDQMRNHTGSAARIVLNCSVLDPGEIETLHARGDCYVSLHKGEGWGYPLFEAAAKGTPALATAYGGPKDYLDPNCHWMVKCSVGPVRQPYYLYRSSMAWAEPSVEHAIEGLRWIHEHRSEARAAAIEASVALRETYSLEKIGRAARARLEFLQDECERRSQAVLERPAVRVNTSATRELPRSRLTLEPTVPIAGEWYDANYFERGLKSNWKGGYSWAAFKGLFDDAALMLHGVFPDASTYLDAGCAKGFLVESLRSLGLEARGFDHSPWAIARARPHVRPYLDLMSIDEVDFTNRNVDIISVMSLVESLTEEQISRFLSNARHSVRKGLVIVIPKQNANDEDLSHITRYEPPWWARTFAKAGWKQHPANESLQRHALPRRMNWNIFALVSQ
jgi:2-polyprenyl-3-methyl-5-hydroxy-6-metoxy-1,4-benzoquinol methylase